jgi:SAM-dependent methyltransferase
LSESRGANRTSLKSAPQPACSLCGTPGEHRYGDLQDRHFDAPGVWKHLACPNCGLVWLDPKPAPEALADLYSDYYTHGDADRSQSPGESATGGVDPAPAGGSPVPDPIWIRAIMRGIPGISQGYEDVVVDSWERDLGRFFSIFGPLVELAKRGTMWLPAEKRGALLDVGCGDGSFLKHMRALGWQISGVERDEVARDSARAQLEVDTIYPDLEAAGASRPEGFDVITLSHVIEHLLDPIDTLIACREVMKPGGSLVIATPNFKSRAHRHFGRNWLHLDPPRHIQLYDPDTLDALVRRAGFEIESVDTPSSSSHFVWQASALIEERGALPGIQIRNLGPWILLESGLFWMWEYLLTRLGKKCGEEVLLVAKNARAVIPEEASPGC